MAVTIERSSLGAAKKQQRPLGTVSGVRSSFAVLLASLSSGR